MKDGFIPLICALAMLVLAAIFLYIDRTQSKEIEFLASEVESFLEDHRTESTGHLNAQQKARRLLTLTQRPNRAFLIILALIVAARFLSIFFGNPKGRMFFKKAAEIWTWRP